MNKKGFNCTVLLSYEVPPEWRKFSVLKELKLCYLLCHVLYVNESLREGTLYME